MSSRREFITLLGGAAAVWPMAARAQHPPTIGFLTALSEGETSYQLVPFRRGLSEGGLIEGKNIAIEYRFADGQYERLTGFATEFVRRPVSLIVAAAPPAALAAKVATTSIPIVFVVGLDPVGAGLVASFNRPGANATGISLITGPLGQKRVEFLQEFMPKAAAIAMLVNPVSPDAVPEIRDVQAVAHANNFSIRIINASTASEIDSAFMTLGNAKPERLLVGSDPFFVIRRAQITALAARLGVPAIFPFREFAVSHLAKRAAHSLIPPLRRMNAASDSLCDLYSAL
jgi:putative tryptophan/tyrosine transport system substrate-binding protein